MMKKLQIPADDAEAIAQILTQHGRFDTITRLPESNESVNPAGLVKVEDLEKAIISLFYPEESCK